LAQSLDPKYIVRQRVQYASHLHDAVSQAVRDMTSNNTNQQRKEEVVPIAGSGSAEYQSELLQQMADASFSEARADEMRWRACRRAGVRGGETGRRSANRHSARHWWCY